MNMMILTQLLDNIGIDHNDVIFHSWDSIANKVIDYVNEKYDILLTFSKDYISRGKIGCASCLVFNSNCYTYSHTWFYHDSHSLEYLLEWVNDLELILKLEKVIS